MLDYGIVIGEIILIRTSVGIEVKFSCAADPTSAINPALPPRNVMSEEVKSGVACTPKLTVKPLGML